jgi:hypothetical protein
MKSALQSFKTTVPVFCRRSGAQIEPLDLQLVVVHTFVHTSCLHLERNSMADSPESRNISLIAVESITLIIQQLTEADFRNLDAILSVSTATLIIDLFADFPISRVGLALPTSVYTSCPFP